MSAGSDTDFEKFASSFVHWYWSTTKDGMFSMPPDEPVEESLEELLSSVSYTVETGDGKWHRILMTGEAGDWWRFGFDYRNRTWMLSRASARSDKKNSPHDLLGDVYASYFRPFLEHVAAQANRHSEQGAAPNP